MTDAEASVKTLARVGEEGLGEVLTVFADYIAPIVGLIFGWVLGSHIGGVASVGQFSYNLIYPIAKGNDPSRVCDAIGGLVMGGVFAILGGAFWAASGKFKTAKWSGAIAKGVLRFVAGLGFGMAANAVVSGLTGSVSEGWIDGLAIGGAEKAANATSGGR